MLTIDPRGGKPTISRPPRRYRGGARHGPPRSGPPTGIDTGGGLGGIFFGGRFAGLYQLDDRIQIGESISGDEVVKEGAGAAIFGVAELNPARGRAEHPLEEKKDTEQG